MLALEKLLSQCPIVADDHLLIAETFLREFTAHFTPKGVIHVGAHQGQEIALYRRFGFRKILLIEANPELAAELTLRHRGQVDIEVVSGAATENDGAVELKIHTSRSGSCEPASLLDMKDFKKIVATLHTPGTVSVPGFRIDSLFEKRGLAFDDYNFMVLDIQGAELMALRGSPLTLSHMDAVQAEAGIIEMYEGGALYEDIRKFLEGVPLQMKKGVLHELYDERGRFPAWGEFYFTP